MKTPFSGTLCLAEAGWPMIGPDRHRRRVAAGQAPRRGERRELDPQVDPTAVPWALTASRLALGPHWGPHANEKRRLTPEDVFRRSAAVVGDVTRTQIRVESDAVDLIRHVAACGTEPDVPAGRFDPCPLSVQKHSVLVGNCRIA